MKYTNLLLVFILASILREATAFGQIEELARIKSRTPLMYCRDFGLTRTIVHPASGRYISENPFAGVCDLLVPEYGDMLDRIAVLQKQWDNFAKSESIKAITEAVEKNLTEDKDSFVSRKEFEAERQKVRELEAIVIKLSQKTK